MTDQAQSVTMRAVFACANALVAGWNMVVILENLTTHKMIFGALVLGNLLVMVMLLSKIARVARAYGEKSG